MPQAGGFEKRWLLRDIGHDHGIVAYMGEKAGEIARENADRGRIDQGMEMQPFFRCKESVLYDRPYPRAGIIG